MQVPFRDPFVLGQPDKIVPAVNFQVVNAGLGLGREPLFHFSGAGIELDDAVGSTAVGHPNVAVGIDLRILAHPSSTGKACGLIFRIVDALAWGIGGEVVLNIFGFSDLGFVHRQIHFHFDGARHAVGTEVLHQVFE